MIIPYCEGLLNGVELRRCCDGEGEAPFGAQYPEPIGQVRRDCDCQMVSVLLMNYLLGCSCYNSVSTSFGAELKAHLIPVELKEVRLGAMLLDVLAFFVACDQSIFS